MTRDACSAGARPARQHASSETANVNASTRQSGPTDNTTSRPLTNSMKSLVLNQLANAMPMPPPIAASTRLSARNCRTRRPRPAPMARRIEISRSLAAARASSSPDKLTHARSRISPTIPIRMRSGRAMLSRIGLKPSGAASAAARWRRMPARSFSGAWAACVCTNAAHSTWTSAFVSSTVAPDFSLASRFSQLKPPWRCVSLIIIWSGSMRSGTRPGLAPWYSGGVTPTMVNARLRMVNAFPMADGLRLKRRCQ